MTQSITARASELITNRIPFVQATVVRAQCPTSARPGDAAIVLGDGSIEGFVGGQCAEESVRAAAMKVIDTAETLLLRILPDGDEEFPDSPGSRTVVNPCLSGGAIEVFLEPRLPAPVLTVTGNTPIAQALTELAGPLGFSVRSDVPGDFDDGATAVIVSSHGRNEEATIRSALDAGVGFIGLVASHTRGTAVVEAMELDASERARVHTPVGIDIGARTAHEIALSIMAQIVAAVRTEGLVAAPSQQRVEPPIEAIDPVCGMTVVVGPDTPHLHADDTDYWFCNPGCRARYADELDMAG
jgi:xanthine dehydrogenase accessory factor